MMTVSGIQTTATVMTFNLKIILLIIFFLKKKKKKKWRKADYN